MGKDAGSVEVTLQEAAVVLIGARLYSVCFG